MNQVFSILCNSCNFSIYRVLDLNHMNSYLEETLSPGKIHVVEFTIGGCDLWMWLAVRPLSSFLAWTHPAFKQTQHTLLKTLEWILWLLLLTTELKVLANIFSSKSVHCTSISQFKTKDYKEIYLKKVYPNNIT